MTQVTNKSGSRYYEWKGEKFPSVTTIMSKGIPKPGLIKWAAKIVAAGAVERVEVWAGMPDDAAIAYLSGIPDEKRNSSAVRGSIIHSAAEIHSNEGEAKVINPEEQAYLDGFIQFRNDWNPKYLLTEQAVFNRTYGYAGTLDSVVRIGRTVWCLDTKTGNRVYPEVALQLAAYSHAEFIGRDGDIEEPMPAIKKGGVVHLFPGGYSFIPVRIDDEVFEAFLSVKDVFHWDYGLSGTVLREPLTK